ncbi:MAG: diacylglycerol kinase family protein [Acidobacteriota bacterium]
MSRTTNRSSFNGGPLPLVIVNPKSAAGSTKGKWAEIASDLRTHFGPFNVAFTKWHGDGIELAKRGIENGRKLIIACGGDGTINEVANGILETGEDIEMGILPSGTGGDFRRTIEMPQTMREAARALRTGETKTIDVGKVTFQNFQDEAVSRYFLNVSSFGLAASIIERVKSDTSLSWLPIDALRGKASFAVSTLQQILSPSVSRICVKIDDSEEKPMDTVNFCVANARYFGGGMKIAPEASLVDGFFDVVNIGDISTAKIILNAHMLYRGTHLDLPEVKSKRARRIEARSADASVEIHIEADGELPGKLPVIYEIVPAALRLRVPKPK